MKTSELTGAALDWAVAKCEGWKYDDRKKVKEFLMQQLSSAKHCYSTVWAKGGPIIEGEIDALYRTRLSTNEVSWEAMAQGDSECMGYGPTPLIAAMRCYVVSKLGDEVEIPEELL